MKDWWKYLVLVLLVVVPIELGSLVAARILAQQNIVLSAPDADGYEEYLEQRDPALGWPAPEVIGTWEYDLIGSRIIPSFPDPQSPACVSVYGDSFTWGDEVSPAEAYANVLAVMLGCRVNNYGIGGYGTDQAYIRYQSNEQDRPPTVVLGHFSDNIVRNVNQLRDFYAHSRFGFKPRFILDGQGELKLVPIPTLTADQYLSAFDSPEQFLPYEHFKPGRPGGPILARFPYSMTVTRALAHYRIQARLRGIPSYGPFYSEQHPSDGLAVTAAIVRAFFSEAQNRGQVPLFMLIPDIKDLELLEKGEEAPYLPLIEWLQRSGIDTIDAGPAIMSYLAGRDICDLYVACGHSHFNGEGYAILAHLVYETMAKQGLIQSSNAMPSIQESSVE